MQDMDASGIESRFGESAFVDRHGELQSSQGRPARRNRLGSNDSGSIVSEDAHVVAFEPDTLRSTRSGAAHAPGTVGDASVAQLQADGSKIAFVRSQFARTDPPDLTARSNSSDGRSGTRYVSYNSPPGPLSR